MTNDVSPSRAAPSNQTPKFVTGSLLRHILTMAGAGAVGLMAIFIGDLANIYFLSLLGDEAIVAAVSYASSIVSLSVFIGVGLSIATTALVAPALGRGDKASARRYAVNATLWTLVVSCILALVVWVFVPSLLSLLGAEGRTLKLATEYLNIMLLGLPPLALAMACSSVLRSAGEATQAMLVTTSGALLNIVLDPILIFGFDLGIHGAAIASTISRFAFLGVGLYFVVSVHGLMTRPRLDLWLRDVRPLALVAIPAVATNAATPTANAYVTAVMSDFGDGAVAGWGIIGRIMPVAFGAIFALSGSVGPIIGQNFGARDYGRMRETLSLSIAVTAVYTLFAWFVLFLASDILVSQFKAQGEAADLIVLFCKYLSPLFVFFGILFVANAAFNTLGRAHYSTAFNWARATLGTIPFVAAGAHFYGSKGALAGNMIGAIFISGLAVWTAYRFIRHLDPIARGDVG